MKTTLRDVFHVTFFGLLLIVLTACGGGGGGVGGVGSAMQSSSSAQNLESAPAPAEPFNIPSATMTTTSGGNSYTAIYSETPNSGTMMFDGQEANSSTISLTITENETPIVTEIDTVYYLENPYQPLGLTLSSNGKQFDFLYNSTNPLPSTLTVGDSGPLGSGTYYVVNTNESIGSLTQTYSVASNIASPVQLITYATGTVNGQSISETIYYAVNASGAPQMDWFEILVNGTTLTFNNPAEWGVLASISWGAALLIAATVSHVAQLNFWLCLAITGGALLVYLRPRAKGPSGHSPHGDHWARKAV